MFDVRLDGVQRHNGVQSERACVPQQDGAATDTRAWDAHTVAQSVSHDQLRAAYDRAATAAGWYAYTPRDTGPAQSVFELDYCRTVNGTNSRLLVLLNPQQVIDVRPSDTTRPSEPVWQKLSPARLTIAIYAVPDESSCP